MKKLRNTFFLLLTMALTFGLVACGSDSDGKGSESGGMQEQEPALTGDGNVIVVYFSWSSSHNTQTMAGYIAEETGGELFRLIPETPYPTEYNQVLDAAQREQAENARPALAQDLTDEQLAQYDVIFVGYPIWYYDAPMIIYTFLEAHDFTGKTIVPFATSGGSGLNEEDGFREITGATVLEGLCIRNIGSGGARDDIRQWLSDIGVKSE